MKLQDHAPSPTDHSRRWLTLACLALILGSCLPARFFSPPGLRGPRRPPIPIATPGRNALHRGPVSHPPGRAHSWRWGRRSQRRQRNNEPEQPTPRRVYYGRALPWTSGMSAYSPRFITETDRLCADASDRGDWIAAYQFWAYLLWAHALQAAMLDSPALLELRAGIERLQDELANASTSQQEELARAMTIATYQLMSLSLANAHWVAAARESRLWATYRPTPFQPFFRQDQVPDQREVDHLVAHFEALARQLQDEAVQARAESDHESATALDHFADRALALANELPLLGLEDARIRIDSFWRAAVTEMFG